MQKQSTSPWHTTCEMLWLQTIVSDLNVTPENHVAIYTPNNPVFHETNKHIEVNCHFLGNILMVKGIYTFFVPFAYQPICLLNLVPNRFSVLFNKVDMINIYPPPCEREH